MIRRLAIVAAMFSAGCAYSPTGPTQMTLTISQSSLPVGGTAVVTATMIGADRERVSFTSSLGTFTPPDAYAEGGIARSTFTATRSGMGSIAALSGSVAAEPLQVRIGEFPDLPPINTTPPAPTVFLSCNDGGTVGVPAICSVSGLHLQTLTMNWGDGSPEESFSPTTTSAAHVFPRAGSYAVSARGGGAAGQVVHASATATIMNPPPPPPVATQPIVPTTSVSMSQEAPLGLGSTCAAFNVGAVPATGTRITSIVVNMPDGSHERFDFTSSARFVKCGLTANKDVLTATASDSGGGMATYQLIVR